MDIDGKHVEMIRISKAHGFPVNFEKVEYIRSGSYTKNIMDYPRLQTGLWNRLRHEAIEGFPVMTGLPMRDVRHFLNCEAYFDLQHIPIPENEDGLIHYMEEDRLVARQDDGLYSITFLGAILFAKRLSTFSPRLGRKAIRIVQYGGKNKLAILKEASMDEGYATALGKAVDYVNTLLPSREDINSMQRQTIAAIPFTAIRESMANALIHQDFLVTGAGPLVEMFANRVEVTNPGAPIVNVMRIVNDPPRSRNEQLSALMRRMGMCEEFGRGWDRMVISCEERNLPAPRIDAFEESTKVSLFSHLEFSAIPVEDKLWSIYLHACIKYMEGDALTNSSLRERFGLGKTMASTVSRLISIAVSREYIKQVDSDTAPRYMRYLPSWAI